jgi:hypothetical protein
MATLGAVVCEAIVHEYGPPELLRRLSHPFWFQSFGVVMGMDWHSSGITTSSPASAPAHPGRSGRQAPPVPPASAAADMNTKLLSACNTAGASGETAEPLSGMARAFFYAGARALLVSHWEVGSDAAVKLSR